MTDSQLIPIEQVTPAELFGSSETAMGVLVTGIEREARQLADGLDAETEEGRKELASIAYKVSRSKTTIDDAGKTFAAELKAQVKVIDARRKEARDALDALRDKIRGPVNEWEQKERERIETHTGAIEGLRGMGNEAAEMWQDADMDQLTGLKKRAEAIDPSTFEEFEENAADTRLATLAKIDTAIRKREQFDAEQAELERLRKAEAERKQKEHDERIAREAVEAEQRKAEEALRKEREARERAEVQKQEAEKRAQEAKKRAEEEQRRKAEEEAAEQQRRERNTRHKAQVHNEAIEALAEISGVGTVTARKILDRIKAGKIPHVEVRY